MYASCNSGETTRIHRIVLEYAGHICDNQQKKPWLAHLYHNERIVVKTRVDNTIEFMAINDREIVIFV